MDRNDSESQLSRKRLENLGQKLRSAPNSFESQDARTALPQNCSPRKLLEVQPACELHSRAMPMARDGYGKVGMAVRVFGKSRPAVRVSNSCVGRCLAGVARKTPVLVCIALQF